jgi:hypothetical protein
MTRNIIRFGNVTENAKGVPFVEWGSGQLLKEADVMVTFEYNCNCPRRRCTAWTKYDVVERITNDVLNAIKHNRKYINFICPMCKCVVKMPVDDEDGEKI